MQKLWLKERKQVALWIRVCLAGPSWCLSRPWLGSLLCHCCSFLLQSFLLSAWELTSQSDCFGFRQGMTWIPPALALFSTFLFYHLLPTKGHPLLISYLSPLEFKLLQLLSLFILGPGSVSSPLCTPSISAVTTLSALFCTWTQHKVSRCSLLPLTLCSKDDLEQWCLLPGFADSPRKSLPCCIFVSAF